MCACVDERTVTQGLFIASGSSTVNLNIFDTNAPRLPASDTAAAAGGGIDPMHVLEGHTRDGMCLCVLLLLLLLLLLVFFFSVYSSPCSLHGGLGPTGHATRILQ